MTTQCSCDHLFKYKTFKDSKESSEHYYVTFEDLAKQFPGLTLEQINRLNTHLPVRHTEDTVYYEILIQELANDRTKNAEFNKIHKTRN